MLKRSINFYCKSAQRGRSAVAHTRASFSIYIFKQHALAAAHIVLLLLCTKRENSNCPARELQRSIARALVEKKELQKGILCIIRTGCNNYVIVIWLKCSTHLRPAYIYVHVNMGAIFERGVPAAINTVHWLWESATAAVYFSSAYIYNCLCAQGGSIIIACHRCYLTGHQARRKTSTTLRCRNTMCCPETKSF
jgi:hypothetical protein